MQPNVDADTLAKYEFENLRAMDFRLPGVQPEFERAYRQDTMRDGLNRTGNEGVRLNGQQHPDAGAKGKRWSLHYWDHMDKTAFIREGEGLVLKGHLVQEPDLTRQSYVGPDDRPTNWDKVRVFAPFRVTANRIWDNETEGQIDEPGKPHVLTYPGTYCETMINVSAMCVDAFRVSDWWMPWRDISGRPAWDNAYNDDLTDGCELDRYEIDTANRAKIMMKLVAGKAGDTKTKADWTEDGQVDWRALFKDKPEYDFWAGWHRIGVLWTKKGIYWFLDGRLANWDERPPPLVGMVNYKTREGNSGAKNNPRNDKELQAVPPLIPVDPGLWPPANMYHGLDKLQQCEAVIAYDREWKVTEKQTATVHREIKRTIDKQPAVTDSTASFSCPNCKTELIVSKK